MVGKDKDTRPGAWVHHAIDEGAARRHVARIAGTLNRASVIKRLHSLHLPSELVRTCWGTTKSLHGVPQKAFVEGLLKLAATQSQTDWALRPVWRREQGALASCVQLGIWLCTMPGPRSMSVSFDWFTQRIQPSWEEVGFVVQPLGLTLAPFDGEILRHGEASVLAPRVAPDPAARLTRFLEEWQWVGIEVYGGALLRAIEGGSPRVNADGNEPLPLSEVLAPLEATIFTLFMEAAGDPAFTRGSRAQADASIPGLRELALLEALANGDGDMGRALLAGRKPSRSNTFEGYLAARQGQWTSAARWFAAEELAPFWAGVDGLTLACGALMRAGREPPDEARELVGVRVCTREERASARTAIDRIAQERRDRPSAEAHTNAEMPGAAAAATAAPKTASDNEDAGGGRRAEVATEDVARCSGVHRDTTSANSLLDERAPGNVGEAAANTSEDAREEIHEASGELAADGDERDSRADVQTQGAETDAQDARPGRPSEPPFPDEEKNHSPATLPPDLNAQADVAELEAPPSSWSGPPELRELTAALDWAETLGRDLQAAMKDADFASLGKAAAALEALKLALPDLFRNLRAALPSAETLPAELPPGLLSPPIETVPFADVVRKSTWGAIQAASEAIEARRLRVEALAREVDEPIDRPEGLLLREELDWLAREEEYLRAVARSITDSPAAGMGGLKHPTDRLRLLERLGDPDAGFGVDDVVPLLIAELTDQGAPASRVGSLLTASLNSLTAAGRAWPPGLWSCWESAGLAVPDRVLGLANHLADPDLPGLVAAAELRPQLITRLPPSLQARVVLARPGANRMAVAYEHLAQAPDVALLALLESLQADSDLPRDRRLRGAFLLLSIGLHGGWIDLGTPSSRRIALEILLDLVGADARSVGPGPAAPMDTGPLALLVADLADLAFSPEERAAVLTLAWKLDVQEAWNQVRYGHDGALDQITSLYPLLVEITTEGLDRPDAMTIKALFGARRDWAEFCAEQEKKSCYRAWQEALRYQVAFRHEFETAAGEMLAGRGVPDRLDPDTLIDRARRDGGLVGVEAVARENMRAWIAGQQERLERLASVVARYGSRRVTEVEYVDLVDALEGERVKVGPDRLLERCYALVEGRMA